jgi:hypothetical protein
MSKRVTTLTGPCLLIVGVAGLISAPEAWAQTEEPTQHQQRLDELKAEAELDRARADRDEAAAERIQALGLPSYSGETKLEGKAGEMEANMLAMQTVRKAADKIQSDLSTVDCSGRAPQAAGSELHGKPCFLVLAGSEPADFSQIGMIEAEMNALGSLYARALPREASPLDSVSMIFNLGGLVSAATAMAGLLRSETQISAVEVPALSERMLASAVAYRLGDRAVMPSAAVGPANPKWKLFKTFDELARQRESAEASLKKLKAEKNKRKKAENGSKIAALEAANARYDKFYAAVTARDASGVVPIVRAARLQDLMAGNPYVLRVYVDKTGGSLINRKHIGTFFGMDPVRVTGALIASYTATDPGNGRAIRQDVLVCRTTLSRLRPVHDASYAKGKGMPATCEPLPHSG